MKLSVNWRSFVEKYTKPSSGGFPVGTRVYKGHQGMGKTLSMVEYAFRIRKHFPRAHIYSNIILSDIEYTYIADDYILEQALDSRFGEDGCLILLDEAHLYFGKKKGIPLSVLSAISQQRKDRKRLVFSSQIWEELDISLRKQVKEIVNCRKIFNVQFNSVADGYTLAYDKIKGEYVAQVYAYEIFKHNNNLYNAYDTLQRISRNEEMIDITSQAQWARAPSGSAAAPTKRSIFNNKKGIL